MILNTMGLILADHRRIQLGELTWPRALAAVPFGGRYRIIDFMLSNMVNSGITTVGVIAMNKYKSLMDHLGTGSDWDLDRKRKGLYILPPYINSSNVDKSCEVDDLTGLLDLFRGNFHKYVILANSNVIFNARLDQLVNQHESNNDDISVLYDLDGTASGPPATVLKLDEAGLVNDVLNDPHKVSSKFCSLGVIVISRELLIDLVSEAIARDERDFSVGGLLRMHHRLKVRGYEYRNLVLRVNSIPTYFASSMRLLESDVRQELFGSGLPVYTKVKDEAPTLYQEGNIVSNCLISDGCVIAGHASESVIFRGVSLARNAAVKNCVIMQDSIISEGVELENVILDKNSVIRPGVKLVGHREYPVVIGKGAIV
jgi:glucose-1-phosphate adenylyltransferase